MANTFNSIWRVMSLYNTDIPPRLIQDWVQEAWQKVHGAKLWSWAVDEGQFATIASVSTGDITLTNGADTVVATTSPFVAAHVGKQIKIGKQIFDIASQSDANNAVLDRNWELATGTQTGSIQSIYIDAPTDFFGWVSVIDPDTGLGIWTNVDMKRLDRVDPQRTASGTSTVLADRKWKTTPSSATTVPTYELWPHNGTLKVYRFLYWKVPSDFSRTVALPHMISDVIIKNYVRSQMAKWPGTIERPNPMQSRIQAADFMQEFRDDLQDAIIRDDEIFDTDVWTDIKMSDHGGVLERTQAGSFPNYGSDYYNF